MNVNDLLEQGIAAARAGRRDEARTMLMQVLEVDERVEKAWLWLSGVVDDHADQRVCLQNVLDLNPTNVRAKLGLEWLDKQYPPEPPEPAALEVTYEPPEPDTGPGESELLPPSYAAEPASPAHKIVVAEASTEFGLPRATTRSADLPQAKEPDYPCPYCSAKTLLQDRRCPVCRQSLVVKAQGVGGFLGMLGASETQRIDTTVPERNHVGYYNAGIAYKGRGMWYMAAKEWEKAVASVPIDIGYRRALGLAYAQIKRYDDARRQLERAQALAPDNVTIREDIAIVDRMAKGGKG